MSSKSTKKSNNGGDGDAGPKRGRGGRSPDKECTCVCPICLLAFNNPVVTECGHIFCLHCLNEVIRKSISYPRCPLCRRNI